MGRFINGDNYPSTGQGLLGNNMFAYCGNNPILFVDYTGEWFTMVIGGIIGAATSAITTALDGGSPDEVLVSAICGAFSGIIGATGVGGLVGQVLASAVSSAVDSGFQHYNKYISGKESLATAITGTLVDAAIGATFGAMGFEKETLSKTECISNAAIDGLKTLYKRGIHPAVKKTAKEAWRAGKKLIVNFTKDTVADSCISSVVEYGLSKMAEVFY